MFLFPPKAGTTILQQSAATTVPPQVVATRVVWQPAACERSRATMTVAVPQQGSATAITAQPVAAGIRTHQQAPWGKVILQRVAAAVIITLLQQAGTTMRESSATLMMTRGLPHTRRDPKSPLQPSVLLVASLLFLLPLCLLRRQAFLATPHI